MLPFAHFIQCFALFWVIWSLIEYYFNKRDAAMFIGYFSLMGLLMSASLANSYKHSKK